MILYGNVPTASGDGEKMIMRSGKFSMMRIIPSLNHRIGEDNEMSETIKDSRKKSLSEAFVNSFGAYPIGYAIGVMILPISVGWIHEDPLLANVFITLTYATVSFVRVYFLRRLFLKIGFDDNFIRLGIRLYHKVTTKIGGSSLLGENKGLFYNVRRGMRF